MNTVTNEQLDKALLAMQNADRILLVAHQKPDGDTSGSTFALQSWLQSQGKTAQVFCKDPLAEQYHFLPGSSELITNPDVFKELWDLYIVCDSGDLVYAGVDAFLSIDNHEVINFDHHTSNTLFGTINLVDDKASSTAEMVYRFFTHHQIEMNREMAICLMTGVFTDTGGFSNAATNESALEMASHFMKKGISLPDIYRSTIGNKSMEVMKLWGKIMSRLRVNKEGIAYTYVLQQDLLESGLPEDSVEGVSNYLSQLNDARAVIVLSERKDGHVKVSMRTYHNDVDLAKLASSVGGGGHKKAAGFTVPGRLQITENSIQVVPH